MIRLLLPAAALLLFGAPASALPVLPFTDTKAFAEKASDVLVVECVSADAPPGPNGITPVQVDVLKVLKGERKVGKTKLVTIGQPVEKGRKYLMASFGGNALDTGFLANADLAVVEIPSTFDLKTLDGKTVPEQIQLVFDARREQVRILLLQLEREKALLEKTAPKPPDAPKLNPPEVKFIGPEVRGNSTIMTFEVNPNADPVPYLGYKPDAFEPKPADGRIRCSDRSCPAETPISDDHKQASRTNRTTRPGQVQRPIHPHMHYFSRRLAFTSGWRAASSVTNL